MSSERKLCFMSWNSNGLKTKMDKVKHEIEQQNCDVVFLQETHSGESKVLKFIKDKYKSFYTRQTSNSSGVAIFIKRNIFDKTPYPIVRDPAGCYILVKCTLHGQLFTLVSVYNSQSNTEPLMTLRSVLKENTEGILLIGGDFNVALNPFLDRTSTTNNKNHSLIRPVVEKLITSFHLVDVWRRFHPTDTQYSYQQTGTGHTVRMSRLDYFFVTEESMQYIKKCEISRDKSCSDHYPVVLEIMFKEIKKLELFLVVFKEETNDISSLLKSVADIWLSCKCKNIDLKPHTHQKISTSEVGWAIRTLIVNDVKRPDGLPLSFYKSYSDALIPYLCCFYNNMLEHPTNMPEAFLEATQVSETQHYIFNVDYLILSSIMARWLHKYLQFYSTDYTDGDNTKTMLLTFKRKRIEVKWSVLQNALDKEHWTEPPCRFRIAALPMILNNSSSGKQKSLIWGCPLSQVMMTLYLKHVANEMIKNPGPSIHISRENVIVRFSDELDLHSFDTLKDKYTSVACSDLEKSSSLCNWNKLRSLLEHDF